MGTRALASKTGVTLSKPGLDDIMMTPAELAKRWRLDEGTLANLRSKGLGLPWVKLPSGPVRYRGSDVLDAEINGARGITAAQVRQIIMQYADLPERARLAIARYVDGQLTK